MSESLRSLWRPITLSLCTIGVITSLVLLAFLPRYTILLFSIAGLFFIFCLLIAVPAARRCDEAVQEISPSKRMRTLSASTLDSESSSSHVCRLCLSKVSQKTEEYFWTSDGKLLHLKCLRQLTIV